MKDLKGVTMLNYQLGTTMVIISHDLEIVDYCTRVTLLEGGLVSQFGTPQELIATLPGKGEALQVMLPNLSSWLVDKVTTLPGVKYHAKAGRNALKLFIDNPMDNVLPIIKELNANNLPFEEVSLVEADFFDYFQVKPWKERPTGESE